MEKVYFKPSANFSNKANSLFHEQKERIIKYLPFADIQHVGSTSIPKSVTKGDLDVVIRVPEDKFKEATEILKNMYEINQPDNWTEDFASFKDESSLDLPFGAQLVIVNSKSDDFVKLRDVLINDPELVEEYNEMKLKCEGKSMDDYRKEKGAFFERLKKPFRAH